MNIKYLGSLTIAALLLTSCSNDELLNTGAINGVLKASVEGNKSDSRAGFDQDGYFYWSNIDYIGVTSKDNQKSFTSLQLENGGGTGNATFTGMTNGDIEGYAVYPCKDKDSGHSIDANNNLKYNFPASYTYDGVDTDFFSPVQGNGKSFNPAMFGQIVDGSVTMKHLGGVICIKIPKMPSESGTLTLTASRQITGTFTVSLDLINTENMQCCTGDDTPDSTPATKNNTVTINFSRASTSSSGVFYVPVPTGLYSLNIDVKRDGETKSAINVNAGTFRISRRLLKKIELSTGSIDATESSLANVGTDLQNNNNVSVPDQIASSTITTISVPADNGATTTSKSLSLTNVRSGATITVSDGNPDKDNPKTQSSVDNFTLSIPNNETETNPLTVKIDMPNTTVTLAGNGGAAKYGTVTAETADNTLVLSSGVEVNEVIVNKGNVHVCKGATLTKIENKTGKTITIYKEKDATLPNGIENNTTDNIEVRDANAKEAEKLREVLTNGGEYTLTTDVTGDFDVSAETPVTIDLNGHTITNNEKHTFTVNIGSQLTIKGTGTVDNTSHAKACIYNNGTVILQGGTYTRSKENGKNTEDSGGNSYYNILNHGIMTINDGVTVKQTGHFSSLIDNGYFSFGSGTALTGYVSTTNHENPTLTINGGTFSGALNTIKNDDNGILKITGGNFTNNTQTTIMNHHDATISGGTFNTSATASHVIYNCACESTHDKGELTISGGSFTGRFRDVLIEGVTSQISVTGGTFSDPNVLHYLGDGANVMLAKSETAMTLNKPVVLQGTVTIDLGDNKLTSKGTYKISEEKSATTAIVVKNDADVTITNGQIGTSDANDKLGYGVYAHTSANVILSYVTFSEMVMYAYNGAGTLNATYCKFQGWLSGWHNGGHFKNCTFTKGKAYYPAAICYGNTTFNACKFYKTDVHPDIYDDTAGTKSWAPNDSNSNGYFDCSYVVSAKKDMPVAMSNCTFFKDNEDVKTDDVTSGNHPYLTGWGDAGTWENQLTINGSTVTITVPKPTTAQ